MRASVPPIPFCKLRFVRAHDDAFRFLESFGPCGRFLGGVVLGLISLFLMGEVLRDHPPLQSPSRLTDLGRAEFSSLADPFDSVSLP